MKASAIQFMDQYINDNKQFIDGNIAQHLILNAQSAEFGYYEYLSEEEIEEFENASPERRSEIISEIEALINNNFNYDISEY